MEIVQVISQERVKEQIVYDFMPQVVRDTVVE